MINSLLETWDLLTTSAITANGDNDFLLYDVLETTVHSNFSE